MADRPSNLLPNVLDTFKAAEHTGLSPQTLRKARINPGGPKFLKLGRTVRYRVEDLDAWLHERLVASTSQVTK